MTDEQLDARPEPLEALEATIEPIATSDEADPGAPSRDEMTVALTPSQMAVGGVILAGILIVGARLVFGRRRGRR
ncbi:MAG TPA: hypothetical protein VIF84_02060 [Candidatus Limnocylindrales bacterium]|jgi:hypothetical protein